MFEILGGGIFGSLLGGIFRLAPEVLKYFDKKNERQHELAMFDKQCDLEKVRGQIRLEEIGAQRDMAVDVGVMDAFKAAIDQQTEMAKAAGGWVASLSASVRPVMTYYLLLLYGAAKTASIALAYASGQPMLEVLKEAWSVDDMALLSGVVNFWILDRTFRFRCEATELPGRTISTSDDQAYGPTTKYAYETGYQDINLQIIASEDFRERAFFEVWMENVINQSNLRNGNKSNAGLSKYYSQYATGQVRIFQVSSDRKQLARYTLYNAYPIQISPMNLSWEEQNTYQRFSVTMTYRFHVVDFTQGFVNLR